MSNGQRVDIAYNKEHKINVIHKMYVIVIDCRIVQLECSHLGRLLHEKDGGSNRYYALLNYISEALGSNLLWSVGPYLCFRD